MISSQFCLAKLAAYHCVVSMTLLFPFFGSSGSFGLLFDQQGSVLLAEAETATAGQELRVGGGFAAGIAASDMCFDGLHRASNLLKCIPHGQSPVKLYHLCFPLSYHKTPTGGVRTRGCRMSYVRRGYCLLFFLANFSQERAEMDAYMR